MIIMEGVIMIQSAALSYKLSDLEMFENAAELVFTNVDSIYEAIECGNRPHGILHCNFATGKAIFESDDLITFNNIRSINKNFVHMSHKVLKLIEIYTFDDDFWQFRLL